MNILYDYQTFIMQHYGGVSRYHFELNEQINRLENVKAEISAPINGNYYIKSKSYHNAWFDGYYGRIAATLADQWQCLRKIDSGKYDIVHATWYDPYILKKKKNVKLVITIHDMIQEIYKESFPESEREKKRLLANRADAIITVSENTRKDVLFFYPEIDSNKVVTVYHGANELPSPHKPELVNEKRFVLFVGGRTGYKNFIGMLDEIAPILLENDDLKLICVGGGDFSFEEESEIKHKNLVGKVCQITATDSELAWFYSNAECFIYPSVYEGFGFPILEAFSCGCPVILNNASCLPEVGGSAVAYFNADKKHELETIVRRVLDDEMYRNKLASLGKERLHEFTWEKTAQETLKVYQRLLVK